MQTCPSLGVFPPHPSASNTTWTTDLGRKPQGKDISKTATTCESAGRPAGPCRGPSLTRPTPTLTHCSLAPRTPALGAAAAVENASSWSPHFPRRRRGARPFPPTCSAPPIPLASPPARWCRTPDSHHSSKCRLGVWGACKCSGSGPLGLSREPAPAEAEGRQMVAEPWARSRSAPAVRLHAEMMAGSPILPKPCPGSWDRGASGLQIADMCLLVRTARGQAGEGPGCPPLCPGPPASTGISLARAGTRPRRLVLPSEMAGRLTHFPAWSGLPLIAAALSLLQPPAACAPRGAPQHGDRGLPEELPALPHRRGPPHVLPTSPRPGPCHCCRLLPPQLPGSAPLPPPGLQVRCPRPPPRPH